MAVASFDMARFDVYANPDNASRALISFFLDVQSDHIAGLQTRVDADRWRATAQCWLTVSAKDAVDGGKGFSRSGGVLALDFDLEMLISIDPWRDAGDLTKGSP